MKKKFSYISSLIVASAITLAGVTTSCSDVDIPGFKQIDGAAGLTCTVQNRSVTLTWEAPQGSVAGYRILQNGTLIASVDASQTSYTIDKVEAGVEQAFTVKAVYADGTVSEGVTTYVTVDFSGPMSAYLVFADQSSLDDDEQASYNWFKTNYVETGKGEFISLADISKLDPDIYGCLWIHVDENGVGDVRNTNWNGKPAAALLSQTVLGEIADYGKAGGNLLLTNHATQLMGKLGRIDEAYNPGLIGDGEGGSGTDYWTINPYLGYSCDPRYDNTDSPLFAGLQTDNSAYSYTTYPMIGAGQREDHNCCWDLNSYGFNLSKYGNTVNAYQKVNKCTVLATWGQVVDYAVGGLIDFRPTATWSGRIVAMGLAAYEWNQNSGTNVYQSNIEKFTANALNYMSEKPEYVAETEEAFYGYMVYANSYDEIADDDERASAAWFKANYVDTGKGAFVYAQNLTSISSDDYQCLFIHIDRTGIADGYQNLPAPMNSENVVSAVKQYVIDGGNLLLATHACQYVHAIGRIPDNCKTAALGSGEGGEGTDIWSANPYQGYDLDRIDHTGHAIYRGMTLDQDLVDIYGWPPGYTLIGAGHREDHNCIYDVNAMGYSGGDNNIKNFETDQSCSCLATWSHVRDYCVSGITEFYPKDDYAGRIIAIGLAAYEWNQNSGVNPYQGNIEKLTRNALDYLAE